MCPGILDQDGLSNPKSEIRIPQSSSLCEMPADPYHSGVGADDEGPSLTMNTKPATVAAVAAVLWTATLCCAQGSAPALGSAPTAATSPAASASATAPGARVDALADPRIPGPRSPVPEATPARVDALGDPLPPGAIARLGTVRLRDTSESLVVAFCPDGATFATGHDDGGICIWQRSTGRLIHRLEGHTKPVTGLLYANRGVLVSGAGDNSLRWWDANGGTAIGVVDEPAGVSAMAMGSTGRSILVAAGRTLQVFESATAARVDELRLDKAVGTTLVAIPGDNRVLVGTTDGNIRMINIPTRSDVGMIPLETHSQTVVAVAPDGRTMAWAEAGGKIRLADVATGGEHKSLIGSLDTVTCLVFSPSGRLLASRGGDGKVRLWNVQAARQLWQADSCGSTRNSLAFSPDGNALAVARADHAVDLLDAATGKPVFDLPGHTDSISALAPSPDGRTLVSVMSEYHSVTSEAHYEIRAWDMGSLRQVWRVPNRGPSGPRDIVWRPDGKVFACSVYERLSRLCDAADGHDLATMPKGELGRPLAFAPDSNTLFFVRHNLEEVAAWSPSMQAVGSFARIRGERYIIYSLALSPDGQLLAVGGGSGAGYSKVDLLDPNGNVACTLSGPEGGYADLRFDPAGARLFGDGPKDEITCWDISRQAGGLSGRVAYAIPVDRVVYDLDVSPDGCLLLTAGGDGNQLCLWEAATGEPVFSWSPHRHGANAARFLPRGRRFCSGSNDTQILIWSLDEMFGPPVAPATPEAREQCWKALAEGPASGALRARLALAEGGEETALFIRQHIKLPPAPDAAKIRQLIAQLDSDAFAAREEAGKELIKIGRDAVPFLLDANQSATSVEAKARMAALLKEMEKPAPLSGEMKRTLRAIAVLEAVGTDTAKRVLESIAIVPGDSPAGRAARAALLRLGAKTAP
jgi:WD40 repeat protein